MIKTINETNKIISENKYLVKINQSNLNDSFDFNIKKQSFIMNTDKIYQKDGSKNFIPKNNVPMTLLGNFYYLILLIFKKKFRNDFY